jgi:hypothetical protein
MDLIFSKKREVGTRCLSAAAAALRRDMNQTRRRPHVHDAPAKKKATIVNGVLTWV